MRKPILIVAAIAAVFFVSCKNSSTSLPIPKNAAFVLRIDASSLLSKLKWEDIRANQWFKDASEDTRDSFQRKLMEHPETSGIDIKSDFVVFMTKRGKSNYMVFEGNLKDASAFEEMLKKMDHGNDAKIEKTDNYSYLKESGSALTSWTKSKFFIAQDISTRSYGYYQNYEESRTKIQDSLKQFVTELTSLKSSNSLASDDRFNSLLKDGGDMHFWMDMQSYMENMPDLMRNMEDNPMAGVFENMARLYKGTISTGVLSFDDGKITVKTKQYLGEDMKKVMDKFEFKPVTQDLVNRIPSQNALGAIVANYPPEASREMVKAMGLDALANSFLKKYGYSLDELMGALKGQMILALNDFSSERINKTYPGSTFSYPSVETNFDVIFGMSVNNKASFDKLVGIFESQMDSTELNAMQSKITYKTSNDWFAVGTSSQNVDKFLAGGNNHIPFADKISGHPIGMYLDLQKLIKNVQSIAGETSGAMDANANMWQDMIMTGGDYKNGTTSSVFTINMVDKSTNSLKQLNSYAEKLYEARKKQRDEMYRNYNMPKVDSVVPPEEIPETEK